jgi:hypothetical protein
MTAQPDARVAASQAQVSIADYIWVTVFLTAYSVGLTFVTGAAPSPASDPSRLIAPMGALVALTALVWLLMVVVRNATVLMGVTKPSYYRDYSSNSPLEWVERPARTFNNLFQVPMLFYVACLIMLVTKQLDSAQLTLAWTYVAMRCVHAVIYIGWNYVPYRFAAWIASCITLGAIWARLLMQS